MNSATVNSAINQYKKIGVSSNIDDASPYRLILMLMDGALARIASAKGHIDRNEIAAKGETIGRAISIIDGLRVSLDKDTGGEIVDNLDDLYNYMESRLLEANVNSDIEVLDEVTHLLNEIKSAWVEIEPVAKEMGKA